MSYIARGYGEGTYGSGFYGYGEQSDGLPPAPSGTAVRNNVQTYGGSARFSWPRGGRATISTPNGGTAGRSGV